uniref:Uncharacterized protein n=1 Tax=Brassica oleracea var. oleracea TaxID=109376 RepID=A0A0D3CJP2_BRAOL
MMRVRVPFSISLSLTKHKRFFCFSLDDSAFNLLLLSTKSISPRWLREQSTVMSPCISRSPRSLCDQSTMMSPRLSRSPEVSVIINDVLSSSISLSSSPRMVGARYEGSSNKTSTMKTGFQHGEETESSHVDLDFSSNMPTNLVNMMGFRTRVRDRQMHEQLKADLVEHLWSKFGEDEDNN